MARNVNVDPTMPRVAGRQIHRCNAPADNPEQYYQRYEAGDRAGDLPNADKIINTYKDDLPSLELFHQELLRFQIRWNIIN